MEWIVALSNRAEKNLRRVPAADRTRLRAAIDAMCADPLAGDVVKLKGQAAFRRRVGQLPDHLHDRLSRICSRHCRHSTTHDDDLPVEHFQEKWNPVFRPKMRQMQES
jgi:hypothetical protein